MPIVSTVLPNQISNLQLWFHSGSLVGLSDSDPVSTWNDSSGNGFNISQSTSGKQFIYKTNQINGRPALQSSLNTFMKITSGGALDIVKNVGGATQFAVVKRTSTNSNGGVIMCVRTNDTLANRMTSFAGVSSLSFTNNYELETARNINGQKTDLAGGTIDTSFHVVVFVADFTNGLRYIYMDGTLLSTSKASSTEGVGNVANTSAGYISISFDQVEATGYGLLGFFAEVGIYNRTLSFAEVVALSRGLKTKYNF